LSACRRTELFARPTGRGARYQHAGLGRRAGRARDRRQPRFDVEPAASLGTAGFLLHDIHTTGPTLDHGLAVIVLVVAIGAGVMAVDALRAWRLFEGSALVLLAALTSYYCITSAAGRAAQNQATAALTAGSVNGTRQRAQAAYDTALADLEAAKGKLQAERSAKRCSICKREKIAVDDTQKAVDAADEKLRAAPAAVPVNAKIENLAAIATLLPFVTAEKAKVGALPTASCTAALLGFRM